MISKRFIKTSAIYTLAGALPMASAILLLPFYQFYLPIDQYGALSVFTTFSMLVQVLITFSFDSSVYIHFHEYKNDHKKLAVFMSSAFVFVSLLGIGVALLALGPGAYLFDLAYADKHISFFPYGLMSVVTSVFQVFFKVNSSLLQSRERPVEFLWSNLLSFSLIALLSIGGLVLFPNTLVGPITGRMVAAIASGLWALYKIFREFGFHYKYPILKTSFGYNAATYTYQIQQWVITNFDRFLMTYYLTLSIVGTYDFALKCFMALDFVIQGLSNSFYPKVIGEVMAQKAEEKKTTQTVNRYYYGLIAVMMLLVSGSVFFFPILFEHMKSGYNDSWKYVPYIGLVYLVRGVRYYFGFPYGALKYAKPLPAIYFIISVVKIGLMFLLIKEFTVYAVIFSAIISGLVEVGLLRYFIATRFHFQYNQFKVLIAPLMLGLFILIMETGVAINLHVKHLLYLVFSIAILFWFYRNELVLLKPFRFFKR